MQVSRAVRCNAEGTTFARLEQNGHTTSNSSVNDQMVIGSRRVGSAFIARFAVSPLLPVIFSLNVIAPL
jgi:hypothetical protein